MEITNENAVWAYSNTGTLAHAMLKTAADGRLVAACRSTITREADALLHVAEDISGRLCRSCETRWNAYLARVERSVQPLQPCESFEVYGAAPEQPAQELTQFQPGQRIVVGNGTVHTVVKMADRIGSEPQRVEVEGGLQWLASDCATEPEPASVPPTTAPTRPQRPAYKTVIKAEITWTLQSRKDSADAWSYVSDHASEETATLRAQAFLIEGSRRHFRVIEHRTEVLATDPIEPPKDMEQPSGRYVVRLSEDNRNAVVDTTTGTQVYSSWSRYPVTVMTEDLNNGSLVVDSTGAIVQALRPPASV